MKKKMLMILMASMMLSMTACGSNNDSKNPETNTQEEAKDDVQKEDVQESENEEPEDVEGLEQYTDKDGNVYYYDINCVPEWWEGKVEVIEVGGLPCLTTVVEDPNRILLFSEDADWRVVDDKEIYESGEGYRGYHLNYYVPEGWEIDYSQSTAYSKCLKSKDMDVQAEIHLYGEIDSDMYWIDRTEMKPCWLCIDSNGKKENVFEKPDYIDYSVETYENYKGYEYNYEYTDSPYLFVRTYPDGRVYYDCFSYSGDMEYAMISITEEDAIKMQNAGVYTNIDEQFKAATIAEKDSDFALFAWMYWNKEKMLDPDSKFYWGK